MARLSVLFLIVIASCACSPGSGGERVGSDNVPGQNTRGSVWRDGIPLYPQAESVNAATTKDGVITQSFMTDRVAPKRLMDWFERELARDGWEAVAAASRIGPDAYRGNWVKDRAELTVSAAPGPPLEELRGVERATQFSLNLDPAP